MALKYTMHFEGCIVGVCRGIRPCVFLNIWAFTYFACFSTKILECLYGK